MSPSFAVMTLATIAVVMIVASVQLTGHLYKTTLSQLLAQRDLVLFARRDPLTGMRNRLALREHFESLSPDPKRLVALLYLDLDGFKSVNDLYGHQAGDALLGQAAIRLDTCLRPNEVAFRIGGDEFIILLPQIRHRNEVVKIAQQLTTHLSEPYTIGIATIQVGASIGIAFASSGVIDLDALTASADVALYDAKQSGRGTFRFSNDAASLVFAS